MRPLILAFYFGIAVLLVTGHAFDDLDTALISDMPALSAVNDADVTIWSPPYKKLELHALPPRVGAPSESEETDATFVRPAWGMFAATVGVFLYLFTNWTYGSLMSVSVMAH